VATSLPIPVATRLAAQQAITDITNIDKFTHTTPKE
jgi:hypothetical protein